MSHAELTIRIAATNSTFARREGMWVGRCLICGGSVCFDAFTGEGAAIEHILPRSLRGTNDLSNLGIAHWRSKGKKGRCWDPRRRHRAPPDRYFVLLQRLRDERQRRWRSVDAGGEFAS